MWSFTRKLGGPDPYTLPTHTYTRTHVLSTCRVRPETSPQVANLSAPSGRPRSETTPHLPFAPPRARPSPGGSLGRGGAGGGRPLPGGGPGTGRGWGLAGLGAGRAGGAGVSLPPSLSPVKSRGAAGLSPVSSSCSLGRSAVTVHRRRRGLHRRVRPPASMATTATCTRFTDDYQLFEELGKYGSPAARRGPPTLPQPPGRYAAPRPAPRPCTSRCSAPSARPTPSLSRQPPPGAPSPPAPCPAAPSEPCSSCPGCCTPRCRRDCSPWSAPGRPQPRPSCSLQAPPIPTPPARCPLPTQFRSSFSIPSYVPRAWHSGPSPALQLQPRCGARVWGDVWYPAPPPASAASRNPAPLLGSAAAPPSPPPIPAAVPGAARRSRSIPLPSALSRPLQQPQPPHPHPRRRARPLQPPPCPPP